MFFKKGITYEGFNEKKVMFLGKEKKILASE